MTLERTLASYGHSRRLALSAVVAALLLVPLSRSPLAEEGLTPETTFERAETLYLQLEAVDPGCRDDSSWEALADVFAGIPESYPTHPLAGDAAWRLGQIRACELAAGRQEAAAGARRAFELIVSRYPSSRYAPRAYLRLGELSDAHGAQTVYYRLLQRYPASPEAREARRRLAGEQAREAVDVAAPSAAETPAVEAGTAPLADDPDQPDPSVREVAEASPTPASTTSPPVAVSAAETAAEAAVADGSSDRPPDTPRQPAPGRLLGVRHYSDAKHTRVVFDLDRPIHHEIGEAHEPPRVFVDLLGASLSPDLAREQSIAGPAVERLRVGINRPGVVRAVLDLSADVRYTFFTLADPARLVIDIPSPELSEQLEHARRPPEPEGGAEARQLSLGIHRVVIDPGHGGTAPGAIGRTGVEEKDLTLDISKRLAANLRQSGYEVLMTRDADDSVSLERRPQIATEEGADLFVSIHINASTNRKLSGFETYYLDLATDPTAAETAARENAMADTGLGDLDHLLDEIVKNANKRESRDLAHSIQDSLVLQMNRDYDDIRDLGVKHAPFVVLVGAAMPAVLIECSFVSHPDEERRLRDPDYRQEVADAIHIGIENFAARRRMISATH